jgi:hypothetical protein
MSTLKKIDSINTNFSPNVLPSEMALPANERLIDYIIKRNHFLEDKVVQLEEKEAKRKTVYLRSTECGKLYEALAKAQATMPLAELNAENPYFKSKYSDLGSIIEITKHLNRNGICVSQTTYINSFGQNVMQTVLGHSSGQEVVSEMIINPPKTDIQSLGSYLTYIRRYQLQSICGIAPGEGQDDDGEKVMGRVREVENRTNRIDFNKKNQGFETITQEQIEELEYELQGQDEIVDDLFEKFNITSIAHLPKSKFLSIITHVRKVKDLKKG